VAFSCVWMVDGCAVDGVVMDGLKAAHWLAVKPRARTVIALELDILMITFYFETLERLTN